MTLILALVAGFLTTLSPCVLPVLPFVAASSLNKNKLGPVFLGLGLLLSFVGVSLVVSSTGYLLGLDAETGRQIAGLLLALSGLLFVFPKLSDKFAEKLSFLSSLGSKKTGDESSRSLFSELLGGVLLGVVWTPCSGPSLGAALGLAAQGGSTASATLVLFAFGLGTLIPLMAVAYGTRNFAARLRQSSGKIGMLKKVFGVLVIVFGLLILSNQDRVVEAKLTSLLPEAWLGLVTRF